MAADVDRVVVWDLGNVLIPWDRHGALLTAVGDEATARRLAEEVFTLEVNVHLDRGDTPADVRAWSNGTTPGSAGWSTPTSSTSSTAWAPSWTAPPALLGELERARHRCVGLSNWAAITFDGVPEAYPALGQLDGIVISGEVGITKPDPAIYAHCEQRFGFGPAQAMFIDDSPVNVEAAIGRGWDAHPVRRAGGAAPRAAGEGTAVRRPRPERRRSRVGRPHGAA